MGAKRTVESFVCRDCGKRFPEVNPATRITCGITYIRDICFSCRSKINQKYPISERRKQNKAQYDRIKWEALRCSTDLLSRAKVIHSDCRANDRKKGFINDLTSAWIHEQLQQGCVYCGDHDTKLTLDRIDNTLPHTMDNVVVACIRCNLTRGSMPYNAWLVVAPGMRNAFEQGLFAGWGGGGNVKTNAALAQR